jgi:hypothetical protein
MRRIVILALSALLVVAMAVPALGAPKNKGTTYVAPSAITETVLVGPTSPWTDSAMGVGFGITGKTFDLATQPVIKHVGGLEIQSTLGVIEIRNFWIDAQAGTVSAEVVQLDARVVLFDLADVVIDGGDISATLKFNSVASNVIVGSDAITGATAATAVVDLP